MLFAELPTYTARIDAPCDVIERDTGRDDRVSVAIDVEIPMDADRRLPFGARFGGAWPVSRLIYGPTGRYDAVDVDYLRSGNDFFAPSHILSEVHLTEPSVAYRPNGLRLVSYRAFQDWAKLVGARDLNLDWERPHSTSRRAIRYTPDRSAPVAIDDGFERRYAFDRSFVDRIRRIVRENFVMRPGGIWMRMPLPVWRLHSGGIGLDPYPRGVGAQTASFALDRLEDLEALIRSTEGRQAEAIIGARSAAVHFLDADVPHGRRDDLAALCRTDVVHAARSAASLLPTLDGQVVGLWHSIMERPERVTPDGRADMARTFLGVFHGVEASSPSQEREAWLTRTSVLATRLATIEIPRLAAEAEALPAPCAA